MLKSKKLVIKPHALYDLVVKPTFADVPPDFNGSYNGAVHEFDVLDEVPLDRGMPIMEITGRQNILKRKDASCNTVWSKIADTGNRRLRVDELYGAVQHCQEEFYQGCLKDFRDQNPRFRDMILMFFKKAIGLDLTVNSYFGNIKRPSESTGTWNWNSFDGIVTKITEYKNAGVIPSGQFLTSLATAPTPQNCYDYLKDAYDKQSSLMKIMPDSGKAFYVNRAIAQGYWRYLKSLGIEAENTIGVYQQGLPALKFEGIPIYVEEVWDEVLRVMNGGTSAHMIILTLRGNWLFGTNKNYGGGAELDQALRVWFDEDDEVWKYKMHLVAGTDLASPEHTVFGVTSIANI